MNTENTENKETKKQSGMPSIGTTYSIVERNKRIFGKVESLQGTAGSFGVKWDDGETTLESKIDNCM